MNPLPAKPFCWAGFQALWGVAATLLLGVLLFGFYQINPGLPEDTAPDGILPYFIVNQVPAGASGFLVAAIFAAAMSSIDSALHSLATCMTVDFYQRFTRPAPPEARSLQVAQGLIVIWGILGILSALYVASTGEALLPFLIKYTTLFLGPLLGIFLMGVLFPRANANGAFYGTIAAAVVLAVGSEHGLAQLSRHLAICHCCPSGRHSRISHFLLWSRASRTVSTGAYPVAPQQNDLNDLVVYCSRACPYLGTHSPFFFRHSQERTQYILIPIKAITLPW